MSNKTFPPLVHHKTVYLQPADAAKSLAAYLEKSRKCAHLHPDAWLDPTGIRFGPKSGPNGGWAIHHLRRIEAGLRGESLAVESRDDLAAQLGEEVLKEQDPYATRVEEASAGDDSRVDSIIEGTQHKNEDEKSRKKREKKERTRREMAEREGRASTSAGGESNNKRKRDIADSHVESGAPGTGANTPFADSMAAHSETWQTQQEYEQDQDVLEGEIGERSAPAVKQGGVPPTVVQHDKQGDVVVPKRALTAGEKAARKAAKRARRAEESAAASAAAPIADSAAKKQFSSTDPVTRLPDDGECLERLDKRPFSEEEDAAILRLKANGVTIPMIAAQLDRNTQSVMFRYYQHLDTSVKNPSCRGGSDAPKRFFTRAEDQQIIDWRAQDVSFLEIARRTGRQKQTVKDRFYYYLEKRAAPSGSERGAPRTTAHITPPP
ncbi:hypothetical protein DOTSEDRAFT_56691 [Dothistroma septosporum NZE10]|uniref:Myb-like domain-containing protein n=1 Tax=Dothistroma septosporum (strain NZE10 / CBS 128990) TaxID=675120 RepID=M2XIF1_DOTSN|nr:hypothetical protein DOTSEDRAFT_56691 [Dothistroma septosporum NZE10]